MKTLQTLFLALLFLAGPALAADVREDPTVYGAKLGLFSHGTFHVGSYELDSGTGMSLGGFLDYLVSPKLSGGLYLDLSKFSAYQRSSTLMDIGVTLKALVYKDDSDLTFRPGIGLGYGHLGGVGGLISGSSYLMVKATLEATLPTENDLCWLGELGVVGGASGGNSEYDMSFGPGFTLRAGAIF